MYLSQLLITNKDRIMSHITDDYSIHKMIYKMFLSPEEPERDFLYYVDYRHNGSMAVLIQSERLPKSIGIGHIESRKIPESFYDYDRYFFRLRFSPVKKTDGKFSSLHIRTNEAIDLLCAKEKTLGIHFVKEQMDKVQSGTIRADKGDGNRITISYVDITGVLEVSDMDLFHKTIRKGIGQGKGFGLGMLQLKPIKEV